MGTPSGRDLDLANALAGVLSGREFKTLKIETGDQPSYNAKTDTMTLPGIPFGDVPEDLKEDLRAYLGHESIGERGHSTWEPSKYPDSTLRRIINGMNDARIDRIALNEWPGAGMSIRSRVQEDWKNFKKAAKAGECHPTRPGVMSSALRYIGENVATPDEVGRLSPELGRVMERLKPILSATDFDGTQEHIIEQAQKVRTCLEAIAEEDRQKQEGKGKPKSGDGPKPPKGEGKKQKKQEKKEPSPEKKKPKPEVGKESSKPDCESDKEDSDSGEGDEGDNSDGGEDGDAEAETDASDHSGDKPLESVEEKVMQRIKQRLDPIKQKQKAIFSIPPNSIIRKSPDGNGATPLQVSKALVGRVMRFMRSLQAAEDRVILKNRTLGELDMDRLADLHRGCERIFTARKRAETESLAVYISVDFTGSNGARWMGGGLREFVAAMNEALGRLEIPTAIVGWYGQDTHYEWQNKYAMPYHTHFIDMKTFDSPWSDAARKIAAAHTGFANADVTALADGISQLARRSESRKLLFFLTDGLPCLDYLNSFDFRREELANTMREVVEKGKRHGILTVAYGLGLGHESICTMNTVFGEGNYLTIPDGDGAYGYSRFAYENLGHEFEKTLKRIVNQQERSINAASR